MEIHKNNKAILELEPQEGKGEAEPITENDTEYGRSKNRRVAFRFLRE